MRKKQRKSNKTKENKNMKFKPEMTWQIVTLPDGSYQWILMPRRGN